MRTGLALFALLPACLSPQVAEDSGDTSVGGGGGSGATIAQIQRGDIGEDETVTLSNVVVTSGLTKKRRRQQRSGGSRPTGSSAPKSLGEPKTGTTEKEADSTENGAAGLNAEEDLQAPLLPSGNGQGTTKDEIKQQAEAEVQAKM